MDRRLSRLITLAPTVFVTALLVAILAAFAASCFGGGDDATADGPSHDGPATSPSQVVASPERFYGDAVMIEAEVSNPIDHRVWEMVDGKLFVIYDRGLDRGLNKRERLRVSGTVQPLEQRVIENELGVNIENHFFQDEFLEDDVALVADEVTRLERR